MTLVGADGYCRESRRFSSIIFIVIFIGSFIGLLIGWFRSSEQRRVLRGVSDRGSSRNSSSMSSISSHRRDALIVPWLWLYSCRCSVCLWRCGSSRCVDCVWVSFCMLLSLALVNAQKGLLQSADAMNGTDNVAELERLVQQSSEAVHQIYHLERDLHSDANARIGVN